MADATIDLKAAGIEKEGTIPYGQRYVQNLFRNDNIQPPLVIFETSTDETLGTPDIPAARYFSPQFHAQEVEKVWKKVWQMACWSQDIPKPGDIHVYDIADISILVVRQKEGGLKAFYNSCLHRGRQIHDTHAHAPVLRCAYHGFTWSLDGSLKNIPSHWDFPQVDETKFDLPQIRVEEWNGFAFVCLDETAPPLHEYLEDIPRHWAAWDLTKRFKSAHVVKKVPANWKTVLDAFIEAYHADAVHPQQSPFSGCEQSQYDVWPGMRHFNRAITPMGMVSTGVNYTLTEQEIVDRYIQNYMPHVKEAVRSPEATLKPGETAREVISRFYAKDVGRQFNVDLSNLDPATAVDAVWYYVFPNFEPWPTLGYPLFYRFRPLGNDPDQSLMDIIILSPFEGERPPSAPTVYQEFDDKLSDVLGTLGAILDQDCAHMHAIQKGMKAHKTGKLVMSKYQESRIRHYHRTLGEYVGD